MITCRKATVTDLPALLRFAHQGQEYFRSKGIRQWINGYPGEADFREDIQNGWSHLLLEDGVPVGSFAVSFDGEPTYAVLYEGAWHFEGAYAVIHRCAVDNACKGRGIAGSLFSYVEGLCRARGVPIIRCDTHAENGSMRRAMEKFGFVYCGVIHLLDGAPRVAYDYRIPEESK